MYASLSIPSYPQLLLVRRFSRLTAGIWRLLLLCSRSKELPLTSPSWAWSLMLLRSQGLEGWQIWTIQVLQQASKDCYWDEPCHAMSTLSKLLLSKRASSPKLSPAWKTKTPKKHLKSHAQNSFEKVDAPWQKSRRVPLHGFFAT